MLVASQHREKLGRHQHQVLLLYLYSDLWDRSDSGVTYLVAELHQNITIWVTGYYLGSLVKQFPVSWTTLEDSPGRSIWLSLGGGDKRQSDLQDTAAKSK